MSVEIKSEHIDINGNNILLISVRGGKAIIGTCSAGYGIKRGDTSALARMFYIGNNPIVELLCPNHGSKNSDKLMSLCGGFTTLDEKIQDMFSESLTKLNHGDSLAAGLHDIFSLLPDGVYTAYISDYYPTDGTGTFFWGAYNLMHEVHGTAEHNRIIGQEKIYRPCFLVPSVPLDNYDSKTISMTNEAVKSRTIQGIAYHLSGLHSVLLKGHHGAVSCVDKKLPFRCAVIERLYEPYTDVIENIPVPPAPAPAEKEVTEEPAGSAEAAEENTEAVTETAEETPTAQPATTSVPETPPAHEGITGFRSAAFKVPLESIPRDMLHLIVETRPDIKPSHYRVLVKKLGVIRRKAYSNKLIPRPVLEVCEQMPDCEMMESVFAVQKLTQPELDALLNGETEYNGKIIISPNFYSSIVTACNFLQFTNPKKFIDFSLDILDNPELYATHEYIANRISRVTSKEIYSFFKNLAADNETADKKLLPIAERYIDDYEKNHV